MKQPVKLYASSTVIGYNNKKWIKIYHKKVHLTYSFEASS